MKSQPLVSCVDAARTFGRGESWVVAVYSATCDVYAGDRIALVGQSGSGKSTLIHLLAGLDLPTAGTISWPALGARRDLPGRVAVVFQNPSLLDPLDVTENVALPLLIGGMDAAQASERASAALALLDLTDLAAKLPEELSGGQAQRVAAARALAGRPKLLLADEPTGQLDHISGAQVIAALIAAADEAGAGLVIATHDLAVSKRLATTWRMIDGRVALPVARPNFEVVSS
ncbi:MAG: ATP-binding cassette domain-containing protein [Acidimicrobiales bacterium]